MRLILASVLLLGCGSDDVPVSTFDAGAPDTSLPDSGPGVCSGGQSSCPTSGGGAACVDLQSDANNCGGCGTTCKGGDLCCAGKCAKTSTCDFAVTKVSPFQGAQSGNDWVKLEGKGFTSDMAVYIGDGRAPVKVLDAQHALIQTPPGVIGTDDIIIKSTMGTALTRSMFSYYTAPLAIPWQKVPMMVVRGEMPGIAVMQDGRVLVPGGTLVPDDGTSGLTTAEIFTRTGTGGTVATSAGTMAIKRWHNGATTMLDGRVLTTGGSDCGPSDCKIADVYNPATDSFKPTSKPMAEARYDTHQVLMVDGRVMVVSGTASMTSEIYDPATDSFTTAALNSAHWYGPQLVRLRDGRVMFLGGDGCQGGPCGPSQTVAELFDVATGKWTLAAPMKAGRSMFTAHTLPDGRVIVLGGSSSSAGGVNAPMDEIEAYDPTANTWTVMTYKLTIGRTWHASALVRDGTILAMGGYTSVSCTPSNSVDQIDPVAGTVVAFGSPTPALLPDPNTEWNAVTMLDGSVLGVGGGACGGNALPDLDFLPGGPTPQ